MTEDTNQSPFPHSCAKFLYFGITVIFLNVLGSSTKMQNFSEHSVNFEVVGGGGLDRRFLCSKFDIPFFQTVAQKSALTGHAYFVVGIIWVLPRRISPQTLPAISHRLSTDCRVCILVEIKLETSEGDMLGLRHVDGVIGIQVRGRANNVRSYKSLKVNLHQAQSISRVQAAIVCPQT